MDSNSDPTKAPGASTNKASEPAAELEIQKLLFEKEKLEFERIKFAAEQSKRNKETEKLDEEIKEFRRPIWRKSSSIGAVATICVAILAGILTFGTNIFKSNIRALLADRSNLRKAVAGLTLEEDQLKGNTIRLQQQKSELDQENDLLTKGEAKLQRQTGELRGNLDSLNSQKKELEQQVQLSPIQTRISLLEPNSPFGLLQPGGPSDESLKYLTDFAIAHRADPKVIAVFRESFDKSQLNTTKAALALILFSSTGEPRWKESIKEATYEDMGVRGTLGLPWLSLNLSYYLRLLNTAGVFSGEERTEILRTLYSKLTEERGYEEQKLTDNSADSQLSEEKKELRRLIRENLTSDLCELAKWDKSASVAFREPWFACRKSLLEELPSELQAQGGDRSVSNRLYYFSPEIYAVALLRETQVLGTAFFRDGEVVLPMIAGVHEGKCAGFDESFPFCIDMAAHQSTIENDPYLSIRIWHSSFPAYGQWLFENRELADALIDPNHEVLTKANVDTMGKLLDGTWITSADLRGK